MNYPNDAGNANQFGEAPKKRSMLIWILPIGCLGLLIVCGGGGAYFAYWAYNFGVNNEAVVKAKEAVMSSDEVKALLGEPIEIGVPTNADSVQNGNTVSIQYAFPVKGGVKNGTMHLKAAMDGKTWKWSREELYVESEDGEKVSF